MNFANLYKAVSKVADTLVNGAGEPVEYVHPSIESDPVNPWSSDGSAVETHYPVRAVFEPVKAGLIDGTNVQAGDEWALIAAKALPVTPTTAGRIEAQGRNLQIVRVETTRPGGSAIIYRLQVRR